MTLYIRYFIENINICRNYSPSRRFRCCFDIESRLDRIFKPVNALSHNLREGRLSSHYLPTISFVYAHHLLQSLFMK